MGIVLRWESLEDGIIYWGFEGYWSWKEYFESIPTMIELASTGRHERIDIICDLSRSKRIPMDVIQNVQRGTPNSEDEAKSWGLTVVVGGNSFIKTIYTLLCRLRPIFAEHYRLGDSLDAALAMIMEHRKSYSAAD
jgi:hypothetical protein